MKIIGIYQIVNKVNGKVYVGSTINLNKRWRKHKNKLKINKHENCYLQNAWNKYGEDIFQFEPIESILIKEKEYILEREQYWLDYHESYEQDKGYNICKVAGSRLGFKSLEETKRKISEVNKGKHFSEEHKQKISVVQSGENGNNAKLTWIIVREIREKYKLGIILQKELAKEYGVASSSIQKIVNNNTWKEDLNKDFINVNNQ